MSVAAVFPGQGSQKPGMGRDFFERFATSRRVYDAASEALGLDAAALCFQDDPRLALTEFQQPAILVTEVAMLAALREGWDLAPERFGGHSLGEYSALVAAGALSLEEAAPLVRERGRLMQEAVAAGAGAMCAVIHKQLDADLVATLLEGLEVDVANRNAPDQVVLSGRAADLETAAERIRGCSGLARARLLPLRVSAPFHSRLMQPVVAPFRRLLESLRSWRPEAAVAVTSNFTGAFHRPEREALIDALAGQIAAPVRWEENMRLLAGDVWEIGPGRPLRGFFAAIGVTVRSVTSVAMAEQALGSAPKTL